MNLAQATAFSFEVKTAQFFAINKFQAAWRKALATPLPLCDSVKLISENRMDSIVDQTVGINSNGFDNKAFIIFQVRLTERFLRILKMFFNLFFSENFIGILLCRKNTQNDNVIFPYLIN